MVFFLNMVLVSYFGNFFISDVVREVDVFILREVGWISVWVELGFAGAGMEGFGR